MAVKPRPPRPTEHLIKGYPPAKDGDWMSVEDRNVVALGVFMLVLAVGCGVVTWRIVQFLS